jgi:hypothetical protein
MKILMLIVSIALAESSALGDDAATRPVIEKFPSVYTAKVFTTPHFYQRDPRWNLEIAGETFCVPASVSDSLVYFAANGFGNLLPTIDPSELATENRDREFAQAELVEKLASANYMNTRTISGQGTTPSEALYGVRRYVEECGYLCDRLQYEGWRRLSSKLRDAAVAPVVDLNWIKSAVADPNGTAWLEIGLYTRGSGPGVWKRVNGHTVAAVGYGTDGARLAPNVFLVDNPAVGTMTAAAQASGRVRPITVSDFAITFTPVGTIQITSEQSTTPRTVNGIYQISGPGIPFSHAKYDAAFLDGAIVLVIGRKS